MNEYVASTVVRFDEAIASFAVKELYNTRLRHRESPNCFAAGPTHDGSAGHSQSGKASAKGLSHSAGPHRRRNVTANFELHTNWKPVERGSDIKAPRGPPGSQASRPGSCPCRPDRGSLPGPARAWKAHFRASKVD